MSCQQHTLRVPASVGLPFPVLCSFCGLLDHSLERSPTKVCNPQICKVISKRVTSIMCMRDASFPAGRHKAFSSLGLSVSSFQQAGTLMALSELNLQYRAPLRAGDIFYVSTAVAQVCSRGAYWNQKAAVALAGTSVVRVCKPAWSTAVASMLYHKTAPNSAGTSPGGVNC